MSIDLSKLPPLEALRSSGWKLAVPARGRSMEPMIREGDVLGIECCPVDQIKVGDIICFDDGRGITVHRAIQIEGKSILEKGDAEPAGSWIDKAQALGRLVSINNQPINESDRQKALAVAALEAGATSKLRRIGIRSLPGWIHRVWRFLKVRVLFIRGGAG